MSRKTYKPEQIIGMLREAEVRLSQGQTVGGICRGFGVSEQTFYLYGRLFRCKCDLVGLLRSVANIYPASAGLKPERPNGASACARLSSW